MKIYNTLGQEIRTLVNSVLPAGEHSVSWDGIDRDGQPVSSGLYLYQLRVGETMQMNKMMLIR